jgi:hypothetical protein
MEQVRRDDGELCGHVTTTGDAWEARVVFGAVIGRHATRDAAVAQVLADGLASLARHWHYRAADADEWEIVCIQEAHPHSVRIALGYYSLPGVPTVVVSRDDASTGDVLVLDPGA